MLNLLLEERGIAGLLCILLGIQIHFKRDVEVWRRSMQCLSNIVRDINHMSFEENMRELYFFVWQRKS